MEGPDVVDYQLSLVTTFPISPQVALPGRPVTYMLTYTSPSNTAPTLMEVDIDGQPNTMTTQCTAPCNYQTGVTYTYTTSSLALGEHYYRFRISDPTSAAVYEGGSVPLISPITLTNSSVTPASGASTTVYTFQTTYNNAYGAAPVQTMLYLSSDTKTYTGYRMKYVSGSYATGGTGAVYQVQTTLPTGNYIFFFVFSDPKSSWADPIAPITYSGPSVGALAHHVRPTPLPSPIQIMDEQSDLQ